MRIATARGYGAGRIIEPGEPVPDSVSPGSWIAEEGSADEPAPSSPIAEVDTSDEFLDRAVPAIVADLPALSKERLEAVLAAEKAGKTRSTLIPQIEEAIAGKE